MNFPNFAPPILQFLHSQHLLCTTSPVSESHHNSSLLYAMSLKSSGDPEKTPLIVSLENPTVDPTSTSTSYQTIRVSCGDEYLDIELRRTLRLPPDDALRSAPAGFGCFPIYLADQYASRLPKSIKEGAFIPIYRKSSRSRLLTSIEGEYHVVRDLGC